MQTPRPKLVLFAGECLTTSVVFASDFLHPATFLHSNKLTRWIFYQNFLNSVLLYMQQYIVYIALQVREVRLSVEGGQELGEY